MRSIIPSAEVQSCLHLFDSFENNLLIRAYAKGFLPGRLWADQLARPTCALLWDHNDWILLGGAPYTGVQNDIVQRFNEEIVPDASKRGIHEIALFADFSVWGEFLHTSLKDLQLDYVSTASFRFSGLPLQLISPKEGDHLVAIDAYLLAQTNLQNFEGMKGWILSFWHNLNQFTESGFGYALMREDKLLGWCLTVVTDEQVDEMGIETAPAYRGQGVAQIVAAATVAKSLAMGRRPVWHCYADNTASMAVAKKIGFVAGEALPTLRIGIK